MKKVIFICLVLSFILACSSSTEPKKPKNLMSEVEMVNVLIDLSLVSSAKGVNKNVIEKNGITPDEYVYKRHGIDSTQFAESNAYYSFYVDDYRIILKRVEDSLYKLKNKHNRLIEKAKKPKVSEQEKKAKAKARKSRDSLVSNPPN